ncbi:flavin reductase family protein [Paracoccus onubensis]|uniref:flavin reductase family protein n=1 Tax=Paracoccus onubensis TaxID=1675788 RepID=UPI002731338B|nr:flavin reductase family protein [Paracoccus onubensis]MDP0926180.1 flavin reductase family protein [Paracoccus onubensis]
MSDHNSNITSGLFREVLGQYPTGVVAVTGLGGDGQPVGMILGSFSSVSLEPPLVSFMPGKASSSWSRLASLRRYCINILGADQEDICRTLTSKSPDRFRKLPWASSARGNPMIAGSLAYIGCRREAVLDAGDHQIVLCRVETLSAGALGTPLLFYRGGYGTFTDQSPVDMVD